MTRFVLLYIDYLMSSSDNEDETDYEEAYRHAIMVKNRLER